MLDCLSSYLLDLARDCVLQTLEPIYELLKGDAAREDESEPLPSGTRVKEYDCVELLGWSKEPSRSVDFVKASERFWLTG